MDFPPFLPVPPTLGMMYDDGGTVYVYIELDKQNQWVSVIEVCKMLAKYESEKMMNTPEVEKERSATIETVNVRQRFNGDTCVEAYVEVVVKVSVLEEDLFEPFDVVEWRAKQFIQDKIK